MRIRRDRLTWREIDGEMVALDLGKSIYFTANRAATSLMRRLAEGAALEDLVGVLMAEYGLSRDTAVADVETFLAELDRHGLLDRQSP